MKQRRLWISLLAAVTLLAQGTASAWMAAGMAAAPVLQKSAEPAMPCHGGQAAESSALVPAPLNDCCAGDCSCSALCAGHAALPALRTTLTPAHDSVHITASASPSVHAPYRLTPLRPPIASQS